MDLPQVPDDINACDSLIASCTYSYPDSMDSPRESTSTNDNAQLCEYPEDLQHVQRNIQIERNPKALTKEAWEEINEEFSHINQASWDKLRSKEENPDVFIANLNTTLATFLQSKPEFQHEVKQFYKHAKSNKDTLEGLRQKKNQLNKKAKHTDSTDEDKIEALETLRLYNHMLKLDKERDLAKKIKDEEKSYHKDFWKTAKCVTEGTFGKPTPGPTFEKSTADKYYKDKYEQSVTINPEDLDWFPNVEKPSTPYDLSAYTPKCIRNALYKKCNNSTPGDDNIVYLYLKKMPYLHKVLATAFTGIRDRGVAPEAWSSSKVILIKKDSDGPDDEMTNFRMISLTLNIGKLYHTLEAQRTMDFMVSNRYLDPVAQKAYLEGINGCIEHVTVVQEIIQDAKHRKKTVHCTWFDLEDAFGSVSHMLIPLVLSYYNLPTQIINYITNLYSKLKGKVTTENWESEVFQFLKGVFQGDPYSGVIFLIIFNPIIEFIKKHKENQGYQLKTEKSALCVNTTPFADDFNIISNNSIKHQQLVKDVEKKLQSMGLILKPSKCRSLSIQGGKTKLHHFTLNNSGKPVNIISVIEKPMKFLGSEITKDNTTSAMFVTMKSKLENKL